MRAAAKPKATRARTKPVVMKYVAPAAAPEPAPAEPAARAFNASGSKYLRDIAWALADGKADVYAVLVAFNVTCPGRQQAIKKLLCSGIRGKGSPLQDLKEARDAVSRAIQLQERADARDMNQQIIKAGKGVGIGFEPQ